MAALTLQGSFLVLLAAILAKPQERPVGEEDDSGSGSDRGSGRGGKNGNISGGDKGSGSSSGSGKRKSRQFARLLPVLQAIEQDIPGNMRPEHMAELIGMSPKYFYAFFKANIGLSPLNYVTQIRMNRARELILAGNLSIKEIAYQLGYADPYTFSKVFKRVYHVAPSKLFGHT